VTGRSETFIRPQYIRATRPRPRNGIRPAVTARGRAEREQTLKRSGARVAVLRMESSMPPNARLEEERDRDLAA